MKNIFIIGSKGIPAKYGGFETFVDKLTEYSKNDKIKYHVSCLADNEGEFEYNGARCFNVKVSNIGSAKAVLYDIIALKKSLDYIENKKIENSTIYILACRIGPFIKLFRNKIKKLNVNIYVNPDGHEWKRSKWNYFIRKYWKYSERLMVKNADLLVCDSKGIETYIKTEYERYNPKTMFIAYGSDLNISTVNNESKELMNWYKKHLIKSKQYYLVVGRFVSENNYEIIINEFMKSSTKKDLVIISNVENNKFYKELVEKTKFINDSRIKFVGTVYDQELLKKIREQAYGYIHGHEVGGTNPSLLEALASTEVNLLLDVVFNKEVGEDGALYFNKELGDLCKLINNCENISIEEINILSKNAKKRIEENYTWTFIVDEYEQLFEGIK